MLFQVVSAWKAQVSMWLFPWKRVGSEGDNSYLWYHRGFFWQWQVDELVSAEASFWRLLSFETFVGRPSFCYLRPSRASMAPHFVTRHRLFSSFQTCFLVDLSWFFHESKPGRSAYWSNFLFFVVFFSTVTCPFWTHQNNWLWQEWIQRGGAHPYAFTLRASL